MAQQLLVFTLKWSMIYDKSHFLRHILVSFLISFRLVIQMRCDLSYLYSPKRLHELPWKFSQLEFLFTIANKYKFYETKAPLKRLAFAYISIWIYLHIWIWYYHFQWGVQPNNYDSKAQILHNSNEEEIFPSFEI